MIIINNNNNNNTKHATYYRHALRRKNTELVTEKLWEAYEKKLTKHILTWATRISN